MAATLQQPVAVSVSDHQQHYKMSIAFLAGEVNDDTDMTESYCGPVPTSAPVPVAASVFRRSCHQAVRPGTPNNFHSLRLNGSPHLNGPHSTTKLLRIGSFNSFDTIGSTQSANSWAGRETSHPSHITSSFSSIDISPVKHHDGIRGSDPIASAPRSVATYHTADSFGSVDNPHPQYHYHQHQVHPSHVTMMTKPLARVPRPSRPFYNEEQKFFVMYYRVIKELSWPEIEDEFASFFGIRSKDGLTSVYYRIRKKWGMEEVLKTEPDGLTGDRGKIETRAAHFSPEFLADLGYFDCICRKERSMPDSAGDR